MTDTVDPPPTLARTAAESRQTRPRAPSTGGFTARDIPWHGWAHLTDQGQLIAGLNLLVELDRLAVVELIRGPHGRPATSPPQGQCFFYFGKDVAGFCRTFPAIGHVTVPAKKHIACWLRLAA
jgi:hypothetical protein